MRLQRPIVADIGKKAAPREKTTTIPLMSRVVHGRVDGDHSRMEIVFKPTIKKMLPATQPMIVNRRCGGAWYIMSPSFGIPAARAYGVIRAKFWVSCSRSARCRDFAFTVGSEGGGEACLALDEAMRLSFDAILRGEDVFDLVREIRFVGEEVMVRFCWVAARAMHLRHTRSLDGVRVGRSQNPLKAAIVSNYIVSISRVYSRVTTWRTCDRSPKIAGGGLGKPAGCFSKKIPSPARPNNKLPLITKSKPQPLTPTPTSLRHGLNCFDV